MKQSIASNRCRQRGMTLVEVVVSAVVFSFVTLATATVFSGVNRQQREARFYSDAQTQIRDAYQRMIGTIRQGSAVETNAATSFFNNGKPVSNASQTVVTVPNAAGTGSDHIYFYVTGGTLYGQRSDDTNAGKIFAKGVTSITFNYFQTTTGSSGTTRTAVDAAPATATEVQVTLVVNSGGSSGGVTTTEQTYVDMRNVNVGI